MYKPVFKCSCCGDIFSWQFDFGTLSFPTRLGQSTYRRVMVLKEDTICPKCQDGWLRPIEEKSGVCP
jgi:hypothetical protein